MPTLLTRAQMHPALAKRVQQSVSGERRTSGALKMRPPTRSAIIRLVGLVVLASLVLAVVQEQRSREQALEQARAALLAQMQQVGGRVTREELQRFQVARQILEESRLEYTGDFVAPHLETPEQVDALLAAPSLYVRLPTTKFDDAGFARAVGESQIDSFFLCLKDSPSSRSEADLIKYVNLAYRGGHTVRERVAGSHRLFDTMVVSKMLAPGVEDTVRTLETLAEVNARQQQWDAARLTQKVDATKVALLVAVLDEPKTPGTPVELDGASDHWVRILVGDLVNREVLVRFRHHLNPAWVSERRRAQYAAGLDACRLAHDFRLHLRSRPK